MTIKMARINGVWLWEVRARDLTLLGAGSDLVWQQAAIQAHNCYAEHVHDGCENAWHTR